MKIINKIPLAISILLLIYNFILLSKVNKYQDILKNKVTELSEITIKKDLQKKDFQTLENLRYKLESDFQPIFLNKAQSISNENISLLQAIGGEEKIIFYFSENSCPPCVDQELNNLKEISNRIEENNIILLASYSNKRHFNLFLKQHSLPFKAFFLNNERISFPNEMKNIPFLTVTDSSFKPRLLFIPDKNFPEFSVQYYDVLKKRFQKQTTTKYLRLLNE